MKWLGSKNRYQLPNEPGPLTRLFWALEDWWRFLDGIDKATVTLLVLAIALWLIVLLALR